MTPLEDQALALVLQQLCAIIYRQLPLEIENADVRPFESVASVTPPTIRSVISMTGRSSDFEVADRGRDPDTLSGDRGRRADSDGGPGLDFRQVAPDTAFRS
jgi:hypothetical protein